MRLAVLFSGGKDSTLAMEIANEEGHEIACLVSIVSKNPHSYMFHTPSVSQTSRQAEALGIPLIQKATEGEKEDELSDLRDAIIEARSKHSIEGVVTGAVESVYQATRVQKICNELGLEVFNPLWQKDQFSILREIIQRGMHVVIVAAQAESLDPSWLLREIDARFLEDMKRLHAKIGLNPAGEGGEYETLVMRSPMMKKTLSMKSSKITSYSGSHTAEVALE